MASKKSSAHTEQNHQHSTKHLYCIHGNKGLMPSSIAETPGNTPASAAENGPMTSPSYGFTRPASAGTAPGTRASEIKEKSPIIAKRPFCTSRRRFVAFSSSDKSFVKPNGSKSGKGRNGFVTPKVLKAGNCPGLPPLI